MSDVSPPLDGKVAIVTGTSRGVGLGIAHELLRAGATVIGCSRGPLDTIPGADEHPDWLARSSQRVCDQGDYRAIDEFVAGVVADHGRIDILVNNAGITRDNILLRLKDEDWDEVLRVNLKGAFNLTRAVARGMMKKRDGVILNVTSVVGIMGNAGQANYAASKAGLIGFTKSVARELASRNIRCNAIAPGFIRTDMTAELGEQVIAGLNERIPLARLGEPEDVAGVARFLAGPGARYITGQVLAVDGGMAM